MSSIKFSVIVPTCHRNDVLAQCLEKLLLNRQNIKADLFEVIVTDDGKNSTAEAMIKKHFSWVQWIKGTGRGPAANRNNGAKAAAGKWLVFTDDDCLPDISWLEEYNIAIDNHPNVKVFEGKTYANRAKESFNEVAPINEKGGNMPSCNFVILKDAFNALGGFDENFKFYFEDMDLSYRIKKADIPILFVPNASVCHPWRKVDALDFWKNRKFYTDSYWQFITKDKDLLTSHNPLFFLKQLVKDTMVDTIPNVFRYKGKGIVFNLSHRLVHLDLLFRTFFLTQKELQQIQKEYSLKASSAA